MKYFVFRNFTIEPFFKGMNVEFSGYEDVSRFDETADRFIWFYLPSCKCDDETVANEIENYGRMLDWVSGQTDKMLLVFTMERIFKENFQIIDDRVDRAIRVYNDKIRQFSNRKAGVKLVDISDFYQGFSRSDLIDWKYYYISQMPLNPKLAGSFREWFQRQVETIEQKRKKCIVLDLDNTLWGGVLGEDGIEGIQLGEDYPGCCYRFFQEYLLELGRNGIILTVCSKNNEVDVLSAWNDHPEMVLRKEHFVAWRINWKNKADNIKEIATELNIGLDSIVFVDDNPTERELVKQLLPTVSVPDFPGNPYLFSPFSCFLTRNYFRAYRLTEEDTTKVKQYKDDVERVRSRGQFVDFESYLKSLEIELSIELMDEFNIVRMAQMTQKTNQFNLTTRRYTETDIREFVTNGGRVWGLRVKDRFGDNGLTGLMIVTINQGEAMIDSLLLSCRILGKNIEDIFVRYTLSLLKLEGIRTIHAMYIPTVKNGQVKDFYDKIGLRLVENKEGTCYYSGDLSELNLSLSKIYKLKNNER